MAVLRHIFCKNCKKTVEVLVGSGMLEPKICPDCAKNIANKELAEHLQHLENTLTLNERVKRIEKWIYEYKPPKSINSIRF